MKKIILGSIIALLVSGCATHKNWSATGGNKAGGTVKLSYQYGMFESPKVSEDQALEIATKRCKAWGYTEADAFGGIVQTCAVSSGTGCTTWMVTKEYQCTGQE